MVLLALHELSTVLTYVGIALFLALSVEPLVRWLVSHRVKRGVAVLIVTTAGVVVVGLLLRLVLPPVATQFESFVRALPDASQALVGSSWFADLGLDASRLVQQAVSFLSDPDHLLSIGGGLLSVGRGVFDGLSGVGAVAIISIYFSATLPRIVESLSRAVPRSRRIRIVELTDEIFLMVGRYVGGQVFLAALNAAVVFIVLTLANGPVPYLLAIVAFVGALVPVVGTIIAYIGIIVAMLTVSPVATIVVAAILLVYAQLEAHLITPRVMSRTMSIPGSLVIIAVLAGGALGGILGALVAVPVASAGVLIYHKIIIPHQQGQ